MALFLILDLVPIVFNLIYYLFVLINYYGKLISTILVKQFLSTYFFSTQLSSYSFKMLSSLDEHMVSSSFITEDRVSYLTIYFAGDSISV